MEKNTYIYICMTNFIFIYKSLFNWCVNKNKKVVILRNYIFIQQKYNFNKIDYLSVLFFRVNIIHFFVFSIQVVLDTSDLTHVKSSQQTQLHWEIVIFHHSALITSYILGKCWLLNKLNLKKLKKLKKKNVRCTFLKKPFPNFPSAVYVLYVLTTPFISIFFYSLKHCSTLRFLNVKCSIN